jgi:O-antigen/teichoic acid export membrane protein
MRFTPSLDRQAFSRTFGYGMWQMLNYLGGILSGQSQKWLLGISLTVASVGFYNVALQLNTLCYLVAYRIGQVLFPAVSELQGRGEDEYAARLTFNVSWLVGCVAISGLLTLAVFVPDVLTLWIGPEISAEATGLTRVLAVASAVGGVFAVPSNYLLGIGRVRWLAALALTQGAISLVAAALLVPRFGLIGAGWAYTLGTAAHVATLVLIWTQLVRRWIGAWAYFWGVFGPCLLGLLFGTGLVLARDSMPTVLNEWQLGIAAVACACAGLALLLVIDRRLPGGGARSALVGQLLGSVSAQLRARLRTGREVLP